MKGPRFAGTSVSKGASFLAGVAFMFQTLTAASLAAPAPATTAVSAKGTATAGATATTAAAPKALIAQGKAEMAAGRLDKAIDLLSKAAKVLGTAPGSCECHFCLGRALCEKAKQQKTAKNADAQKNYLAARRELRAAIRVGRGNEISKKANMYMVANLPPSLLKPRTGDGTEMIAARLGLHGQDRGAGGVARAQVFEFYAAWCKPCNDLKPVLARVKKQYGDQIEIKSFNVDDDSAQDVIDQYEVSPIPTIIYLTPDSKVVGYSVGFAGESNVQKQLQKILLAANAPADAAARPAAAGTNGGGGNPAADAPVADNADKTQVTNSQGSTPKTGNTATDAPVVQPKTVKTSSPAAAKSTSSTSTTATKTTSAAATTNAVKTTPATSATNAVKTAPATSTTNSAETLKSPTGSVKQKSAVKTGSATANKLELKSTAEANKSDESGGTHSSSSALKKSDASSGEHPFTAPGKLHVRLHTTNTASSHLRRAVAAKPAAVLSGEPSSVPNTNSIDVADAVKTSVQPVHHRHHHHRSSPVVSAAGTAQSASVASNQGTTGTTVAPANNSKVRLINSTTTRSAKPAVRPASSVTTNGATK